MILYSFSVYDLMRAVRDTSVGTKEYSVQFESASDMRNFEFVMRGLGVDLIPSNHTQSTSNQHYRYNIKQQELPIPTVYNYSRNGPEWQMVRKIDAYDGTFYANIGITFLYSHSGIRPICSVGSLMLETMMVDGVLGLYIRGSFVMEIKPSSPVWNHMTIEIAVGESVEVYVSDKLVFTQEYSFKVGVPEFIMYVGDHPWSHFILSDSKDGAGRLGRVRVKPVPLATEDNGTGDFVGRLNPDYFYYNDSANTYLNKSSSNSGFTNTSAPGGVSLITEASIGKKLRATIDSDLEDAIAVMVGVVARKDEPSVPDTTITIQGSNQTRRASGTLSNHTFTLDPTTDIVMEIGVHRERLSEAYEFARIPAEYLDIYKFDIFDQRSSMAWAPITSARFGTDISFVDASEYTIYGGSEDEWIPITKTPFNSEIAFVDASEYAFHGGIPLTKGTFEADIEFVEADSSYRFNDHPMMYRKLNASIAFIDASTYQKIDDEEPPVEPWAEGAAVAVDAAAFESGVDYGGAGIIVTGNITVVDDSERGPVLQFPATSSHIEIDSILSNQPFTLDFMYRGDKYGWFFGTAYPDYNDRIGLGVNDVDSSKFSVWNNAMSPELSWDISRNPTSDWEHWEFKYTGSEFIVSVDSVELSRVSYTVLNFTPLPVRFWNRIAAAKFDRIRLRT